MNDDRDLQIKLDIRNDPQPADDTSLIWIRAQVYTVVGSETYIPPPQDVTFKIEDGAEGQSNAEFVGTGTKQAHGKSNETTGWTSWQYFKSGQDGIGTVKASLSANTRVFDTKPFSFVPVVGILPSSGILEVFGQAYYWTSEFSYLPNIIGAYAPNRYAASAFFFEPAGTNAVKIRDSRNRYVNVSSGQSLLTMDGPGTAFTVGVVKGQNAVMTLEANGRYVCAYSAKDDGWDGYNLLAIGTNPDDQAAFFQVQPKPLPPYDLKITRCPGSMKLGESAQVSGTLTGPNGPVASAVCNVNYRNTLKGPSTTQCTDGKFSFTVTADAMPEQSEAFVAVSYQTPEYTAADARWIKIIARQVAIHLKGTPYYWSCSQDLFTPGKIVADATSPADARAKFTLEIVRQVAPDVQAVKIRDDKACYVKVEGNALYATGLDATIFRMATVNGSTVRFQQSNDEYVYGIANGADDRYDLYADGRGGDGALIDFELVDTSMPASITLQSVPLQLGLHGYASNFGLANVIAADTVADPAGSVFQIIDAGGGNIALKASNGLFIGAFDGSSGALMPIYFNDVMCANVESSDDPNAAVRVDVVSGDLGYGSVVRLVHQQSGKYYKVVLYRNDYCVQAITTDPDDVFTQFHIGNPNAVSAASGDSDS